MTYLTYYLLIGLGFFCGGFAGNPSQGINETKITEIFVTFILCAVLWPFGLTCMWKEKSKQRKL